MRATIDRPKLRGTGLAVAMLAAAGPLATLVFPDVASAHALVGRKDLPVPAWLFAWGASLVLIISFALLSVAWTTARLQDEDWRAMPRWFSRAALNPATQVACGLIGVGLLFLVLYSGFRGIEDPTHNFSIIFVFYTFWLGMVLLSVLLGDVFRAFNPWRAIGRVVSGGFRLVAGQSAPAPFSYPERLGRWPAVLGVLLFVWLELIAGGGIAPISAQGRRGHCHLHRDHLHLHGPLRRGGVDRPRRGVQLLLRDVLAARSVRKPRGSGRPAQVPERRAPVGAGAGRGRPRADLDRGDQLRRRSGGRPLRSDQLDIRPLQRRRFQPPRLIPGRQHDLDADHLAVVSGSLLAGVAGMHTVRGSPSVKELGRSFAHSLIPIALAYLVAHYFSAFLYQEQAQFTYILSDPLGHGSDLFGTAGGGINYGIVSSNTVWYVQVGALVVGHVVALTLAHDRALVGLRQRSQRIPLAVLHACGDGRVHLLRAVPALAGERC